MLKTKKINYDYDFSNGCETCDYGSKYISDIEIVFEDDSVLKIETSQMYEYTLTESDYINLISNSEDIDRFYKNMFLIIKNKSYDIENRVNLEDMIIRINNKKIDIIQSVNEERLIEEKKY